MARFCDGCGTALIPKLSAPTELHTQRWMVHVPTGKVLPAAVAARTVCPRCNGKLSKTEEGIERGSFWSKRTAEHRGDGWRTRAYDLLSCQSCGFAFLVSQDDREKVRYEVHSDTPNLWDGHLPLLRRYRGTCQTCNRAEQSYRCPSCRKVSCTSDWSLRHRTCVQCAPKCYICGRVSKRRCKDCKRPACGTHGKGMWNWDDVYAWVCSGCRQRRENA